MAQQYAEMYHQDFNTQNRSPSRLFNSGSSINRQTSRQFENSYPTQQHQSLYQDDFAHLGQHQPRFDRLNSAATLHNNHFALYDNGQPWNGSYMGAPNGVQTIGRIKGGSRRAQIPSGWLDQQSMPPPPPPPSLAMHSMGPQYVPSDFGSYSSGRQEEEGTIPTALVIKNIPFAIKKETLLETMKELNLPLPYAFNYHFDAGIFRGLAFANYTTADETDMVLETLHNYEFCGRRLRVEHKKMLPPEEREKIEREKRERRGQLQEQHQPQPSGQRLIQAQSSMSSLTSNNQNTIAVPTNGQRTFDLNDPSTLEFYNELMLFKRDTAREHMVFPPSVTPAERRIIHTLSHNMNLDHKSEGTGDGRHVVIFKKSVVAPQSQLPSSYYNTEPRNQNRGLNRAATVDLTDVRDNWQTLRERGSGFLGVPSSPGVGGFGPSQNLRAAKSFADLRSYTPSPVPSSASFPAGLAQNISRYTDYGNISGASGTPNLTPTSVERVNGRDEQFVLNGLNNLAIGFERPQNARAHNGGRIGQERETFPTNAGAIGSQRPNNTVNFEETQRNGNPSAIPERQPRGPTMGNEWGGGNGFPRPRQNGHVNRGSDSSDRSARGLFNQ